MKFFQNNIHVTSAQETTNTGLQNFVLVGAGVWSEYSGRSYIICVSGATTRVVGLKQKLIKGLCCCNDRGQVVVNGHFGSCTVSELLPCHFTRFWSPLLVEKVLDKSFDDTDGVVGSVVQVFVHHGLNVASYVMKLCLLSFLYCGFFYLYQ